MSVTLAELQPLIDWCKKTPAVFMSVNDVDVTLWIFRDTQDGPIPPGDIYNGRASYVPSPTQGSPGVFIGSVFVSTLGYPGGPSSVQLHVALDPTPTILIRYTGGSMDGFTGAWAQMAYDDLVPHPPSVLAFFTYPNTDHWYVVSFSPGTSIDVTLPQASGLVERLMSAKKALGVRPELALS